MANDCAPKLFLRQAENALLREYFLARGELAEIDWDNLDETEVDPVYEAWQALSEEQQEEVEQDFRDIFGLASAEGTRTLIVVVGGFEPSICCASRRCHASVSCSSVAKACWAHRQVRPAADRFRAF